MSPIAGFVTRLQDHRGARPLPGAALRGLGDALRRPGPGGPRRPGAGPGPSRVPDRRRIAWTVALVVVGLVAATYLVLRLTGLSAVQHVTVVGLQGPNAPELRAAIERASVGQSTLGFDDGGIRRITDDVPSITGVDVSPRFPHGLQVEVTQRIAVGAMDRGGARVAIAADGALIADWPTDGLPLVVGARASGDRVDAATLRRPVAVLAGAPEELLPRIDRVERGTVVRMKDGPTIYFRDASRLTAKWIAAVAVLADEATGGATWIDLRVPEQPLAGRGTPPSLPKPTARASEPDDGARTATAGSGAQGATPSAGRATTPTPRATTPSPDATTGASAPTATDGATGAGAGAATAPTTTTSTPAPAPTTGATSGGAAAPETAAGAAATPTDAGATATTGGESGGAVPSGGGRTP
ncbi:MAG: cell division protein FtsQ/DivIB [Solirubrobacteraceae bacterium]|nr:cell division protein FtsQ/DivIB [Solirubrobacteraceae bacterium]